MKKKKFVPQMAYKSHLKTFLIMKMILTFLIVCVLQVHGEILAQTITLKQRKVNIEQLFREIKRQTDYNVICCTDIMETTGTITVVADNKKIYDSLYDVLYTPRHN